MRGLKLLYREGYRTGRQSHLLQMRGLKQAFESGKDLNTVASFTDAWIETSEDDRTTTTRCRIFYRCVD